MKMIKKTNNTKAKAAKKRPAPAPFARSKGHVIKRLAWLLLKLSLALFAVLLFYGIYLDQIIEQKFTGQKWHLPAQVFGRAMALYPGAAVSHNQLMAELKLLGYRKVTTPRQVGEFSASSTRIELWRRPFLYLDGQQAAQRVMISFDTQGVSTVMRLADKRQLALFHLEPMLLDRIMASDGEDRLFVAYHDIPTTLVQALLLVEDRNFYQHYGVDPLAVFRAAVVNLTSGRAVQGGSTLTQQLAKNFFLSSERSLWRKAREAMIAAIIDFRYSKTAILEAYFNEVYMGQNKSRAVHGMGLAAQFYFNRPINELTISQQAFLVAVIKGPSYYNPWKYPERALARRDLVLRLLMEAGELNTDEYQVAVESSLGLRPRHKIAHKKLPAFLAHMKRELTARYGKALLTQSGVKIYTSLDPLTQASAEAAVSQTLQQLDKKHQSLQVGMVVTDKYSGGIAAMVGDKVPAFDGFNRAVDIRRPIGSLIKPFVYATALGQDNFTLATMLNDQPVSLKNGQGEIWSPQNVDKKFRGQVSLLTAMTKSINVPTVNLGLAVGVNAVADMLTQAGWDAPLNPYPSMLLGAVAGSPLMVAQVYQTLASAGRYQQLTSIIGVLDSDNDPLQAVPPTQRQALSPEVDYLVQYAMTQVVRAGTAARLGNAFPAVTLAGKTGTSNDSRDSWFAGFDERNVAAVWVGRDDNEKTQLYGSSGAMAVYQAFLKHSSPMSLRVAPVNGVIDGYFDSQTGIAKTAECSDIYTLPALARSYHPVVNCGEPLSWWQQLLGHK